MSRFGHVSDLLDSPCWPATGDEGHEAVENREVHGYIRFHCIQMEPHFLYTLGNGTNRIQLVPHTGVYCIQHFSVYAHTCIRMRIHVRSGAERDGSLGKWAPTRPL